MNCIAHCFQCRALPTGPRLAALNVALLATLLAPLPVRALEFTAGDYEIYPSGVNIGLLYGQHAERSDLYVKGDQVSNRFDLDSDIGLARYIRPVSLGENVTVDLNAILPFGTLRGRDDARVLGRASGTADLILGAPFKFLLDPGTRDAFSIAPFVYVPTGSYDSNKPLNLGEHRWKGLLQLVYVGHFGQSWALDTGADVEVHGTNDRYGPTRARLSQNPRYEVQAHLRYILSPASALSLGVGHYWGGRDSIDGVGQDDRLRTTYGRVTGTHFFDQTTQIQVQLGRDLSVYDGAKEKVRLNLRLAKIF